MIMVQKQILAEQQLKCFSMQTFVHLKVPVAVKLKDNLPSMPYVCNVNIKPSYQTLSKAFEMSKNTPVISTDGLYLKLV